MDNQFYFPGLEPPEFKEVSYLDSIMPNMKKAVEENNGDSSLLSFKATNGYSVVSFGVLTVFRLRLRKKQNFVSVPITLEDLIPVSWPRKTSKSEEKYIRIDIDPQALETYTDFLISLTRVSVDRYPKEWDCCSRYLECSDTTHCVHPDKAFALSCGYRTILGSGKIFYGKNRNI